MNQPSLLLDFYGDTPRWVGNFQSRTKYTYRHSPAGLLTKILQCQAKVPYGQRIYSGIGNSRFSIEQIEENAVVLLTRGFSDALHPDSNPPLKYYTDKDHACNHSAEEEDHRVGKTTRVYKVIGNHPRLVWFLGRDPWTVLLTLEKPYAMFAGFIKEYHAAMYAPRGGS